MLDSLTWGAVCATWDARADRDARTPQMLFEPRRRRRLLVAPTLLEARRADMCARLRKTAGRHWHLSLRHGLAVWVGCWASRTANPLNKVAWGSRTTMWQDREGDNHLVPYLSY